MTERSWNSLEPKLAPNPQEFLVWPTLIMAFVTYTGGWVLVSIPLILLFAVNGIPTNWADLGEESTWRLVADMVGLYMMGRMITNVNNFFGLSRPLGYISCAFGVWGIAWIAVDLVSTATNVRLTAALLQDPWMLATLLGTLLAGAVALRVGNTGFRKARQHMTKIVVSPKDLHGLEYSLYLRTFDRDRELSAPQPFSVVKRAFRSLFFTEFPAEVSLADAMSSDQVPMICVGRPGEAAPPAGALRVYLPREGWKPRVHDLMKEARHVVLTLGWGEGTLWELGEAMRILSPEQLILVVPMEQAEYERFRRRTASLLPAQLPAYAGRTEIRSAIRGLITFSGDWKGSFVPLCAYSPFHNSLRMALIFASWPALRRLGYPPRGVLRMAPDLIH